MKLWKNLQTFLSELARSFKGLKQSQRLVVFFVSFMIVGAIVVLVSYAATNSFGVEPENGTGNGNVSIENDASASGGSFVRFGVNYRDIFVSTSGSNNAPNDGSTPALAVKTIAKAVSLATDNTRIRILAGTYVERIQIQKNNLVIEPYGNGDVIINGAIPELLNTVSWTPVQSGVYKYTIGRDEYNSDGSNTIYNSNGQQLWTYPDLTQLQNRTTVNQQPGVFVNNFVLDQAIYVATNTGQAPTAPLYVGAANPTIYIKNASNIAINGLSSSKLKLMYGSYNIQISGGDSININNVDITGGKSAVAAFDTSNLSITNSELHGTFNPNWVWKDVKERSGTKAMENQAVQVKGLTKNIANIIVDGNNISGYFNGIGFTNSGSYFTDDSRISDNIIHDSIDDGIELDSQYRNLVVNGNTVYDVYNPLSSTGGSQGPVDIFENVFVAQRTINYGFSGETSGPSFALKLNNDTGLLDKNIRFYFNTFYFAGNTDGNLRKTIDSTSTQITKNVSFINNIFYSTDGGIVRGSGRAQDLIEWDGNLFYSQVNDPDNFWSWNEFYSNNNINVYNSLSAIIAAGALPSQWQGNIEGNPGFNCVDASTGTCFRATASITKPASRQQIPTGFTDSARLNSRTRLGALE